MHHFLNKRSFVSFFALLIFTLLILPKVSAVVPNNRIPNEENVKVLPTGSTKSGELEKLGNKRLITASVGANLKQKNCEIKGANIKKRSLQMTTHAENMMRVFDRISERVQNYYQQKLVPNGQTLPNYQALIADIQAKRNAIPPLLTAAKVSAESFTCNNQAPGTQVKQFNQDIQQVIAAMHVYRKSVRNLIVAVGGLRGDKDKDSTESSKPKVTTTVTVTEVPEKTQ